MAKLSIRDLDLAGKRVFVRVDFNVPLDGQRITDDTRIAETLPTLKLARERGARLVLASHLGRPKGNPDPKYSLRPVSAKLAELTGVPVDFAPDCVGPEAESKSRALKDGGGQAIMAERALRRAGGGEFGRIIHFTVGFHPAARFSGTSFIEYIRSPGANA